MPWANHLHRFLLWLPVALGAVFSLFVASAIGAAQAWPEAKEWGAHLFLGALAMIALWWVWLAAAVIIAGWIVAFIWTGRLAHAQPKGPSTPGASKGSLDHTVELSCAWVQMPETVPPSGWFELGSTLTMGITRATSSHAPGAPNNHGGPEFPPMLYRCRLTNFGEETVLSVYVVLTFKFYAVVKQENGYTSGEFIKSEESSSPVVNLRAGETYDFYVRNYSNKAYVILELPRSFHFQVVGNDAWQEAALIGPRQTAFSLAPFTERETE